MIISPAARSGGAPGGDRSGRSGQSTSCPPQGPTAGPSCAASAPRSGPPGARTSRARDGQPLDAAATTTLLDGATLGPKYAAHASATNRVKRLIEVGDRHARRRRRRQGPAHVQLFLSQRTPAHRGQYGGTGFISMSLWLVSMSDGLGSTSLWLGVGARHVVVVGVDELCDHSENSELGSNQSKETQADPLNSV